MTRSIKLGTSYSVAFSRDSSQLSTIGRDVWVWDVVQRKKLFRSHPLPNPSYVDFSPDGNKLAVKSTSGKIAIISSKSGEIISDFQNKVDGEGSKVLYSECGSYLIDGTWDGRLIVRDADSGFSELAIEFPDEMIRDIHRCASSGHWVIEHSPKATAHNKPPPPDYFSIWKWPFSDRCYELSSFRIPFISASSLSPNGQFIAVMHGAPPNAMSVFDLSSGIRISSIEVHNAGAGRVLAWSADGQFIASVQNDAVRFYTFPRMTQAHETILKYASDVTFSPDNMSLALGSWNVGWLHTMETITMKP